MVIRAPASRPVYPRVCGGTGQSPGGFHCCWGLSPRVRGNQIGLRRHSGLLRSIPACAGEPPGRIRPPRCVTVYPRVCGGTENSIINACHSAGLSPRVRGNRIAAQQHPPLLRSIPACAGEPKGRHFATTRIGVYPRVCGGTDKPWFVGETGRGLSPRVRGNQLTGSPQRVRTGSIPACAGEPPRAGMAALPDWVYPRVCGGTRKGHFAAHRGQGLSPRVRGNPAPVARGLSAYRSIPACAGEPGGNPAPPELPPVYPRVCGGTAGGTLTARWWQGLSPRVRGNPAGHHRSLGIIGSIPACAGEPRTGLSCPASAAVYPRVCGGTPAAGNCPCIRRGLSPRVRGNPNRAAAQVLGTGSIPACAGEPAWGFGVAHQREVYPRVCGGTAYWPTAAYETVGLSPRVRGNPGSAAGCGRTGRSIPACAGEPLAGYVPRRHKPVYPRVCGGTNHLPLTFTSLPGLSPRVRGNPKPPGASA